MAEAPHERAQMAPPSGETTESRREVKHRGAAGQYICPMHPEMRQDQPGTCPKCGMKLQPAGGEPGAGMEHAQDHDAMLRDMRAPWLWTNATVMALGVWLLSSPATFGHRSAPMIWSDVASGVLLVLFSGLAFVPRFDFIGRWSVALVGTWLQFAPLVFWAPTAAAYLNDTIVGALAIALSILVPMMPGMAHHMAMMQPGPEIRPAGHTTHPPGTSGHP